MDLGPSSRRLALRRLGLIGGLALAPGMSVLAGTGARAEAADAAGWRMPDEAERHAATWMSFGPSEDVWGRALLRPVREHLAGIARAIAAFEPVRLFAREEDVALARRLCGAGVEVLAQPVDDLWMRDTGPVFVRDRRGRMAGVDFNFNGWGGKQVHAHDAEVAAAVADEVGVTRLESALVLEGGGIEVDGQGTAIITESCVLNANRNPGVGKAEAEQELRRLLGIEKVIWLPGIAGKDITDGHTDFYARFTQPGTVVAGSDEDPASYDHPVTRRHLEILRGATDARGRRLKVIVLPGPGSVRPAFERPEFAAGYINFYVCNGAVIAPQFGDTRSDANARAILREQFPGREIVQLDIDAIAAGGGGIHCTTQQQPA
ncbi:MAG: agmatine deiminase family protein [Mitsuaria chitosanitabida]|uniref:agmatine deiminase family protein n=1 Tax=Roseateles chitosanitabidus TaxID=65048 RepID=UPI001AFDE2D0|nr:agmatine deiminase family protein [Roseateles chitosanitabidus]MBO9685268.1 agmatine deiminase family protein [Roseateles chitosanitabidus]